MKTLWHYDANGIGATLGGSGHDVVFHNISESDEEYATMQQPHAGIVCENVRTPEFGKLIQAAPDLLAALGGLVELMELARIPQFEIGVGDFGKRLNAARAALAKAIGESP